MVQNERNFEITDLKLKIEAGIYLKKRKKLEQFFIL
jgi:hypothetical protein